jgi:hypothetical protein
MNKMRLRSKLNKIISNSNNGGSADDKLKRIIEELDRVASKMKYLQKIGRYIAELGLIVYFVLQMLQTIF